MKLLDRDEPLDPRERRELEAIDSALSGKEVEPDLAGFAELTELIAAERPSIDEEWAAELDRITAAGFPRRGFRASLDGLAAKLGSVRPMRIAGPAGALASFLVVAVVAISTLNEGDTSDSGDSSVSQVPPPSSQAPLPADGISAEESVPRASLRELEAAAGDSAAGGGAAGDQFTEQAPANLSLKDDRIAPGTDKRQIDRDVQLTLSTRPEEVRDLSDQVISITRSLDGIVASSQVSVNDGGRSQATLQLTLPSRNLDSAIDQLTDLANVDSLNEATEDITRPFVSAQDQVDDLEALRERLLEALGNASTDAEADALKLQIEDARAQLSQAEAALENVARKARLSDLSVTIVGDPNAKEDRDLGAWIDDAKDVLSDVAGVLLISAAILFPLGILVALGWLAGSRSRRRRRERALD